MDVCVLAVTRHSYEAARVHLPLPPPVIAFVTLTTSESVASQIGSHLAQA